MTLQKKPVHSIGIIYFLDGIIDTAIIFDDKTPNGRTVNNSSTLALDTYYASNAISSDILANSTWQSAFDCLAKDNDHYFRALLKELIYDLDGKPDLAEYWELLMPIIRHCLSDALNELGCSHKELNVLDFICKKITKDFDLINNNIPVAVIEKMHVPAWTTVKSKTKNPTQKEFIQLKADRHTLGQDLLKAQLPVGEWVRHDADFDNFFSINDLLNLREENQDIIAFISIADKKTEAIEGISRLPSIENDLLCMYLIGHELAILKNSNVDFEILHYYIGSTQQIETSLTNSPKKTLKDLVVFDLVINAIKTHQSIGFWVIALESAWIYSRVIGLAAIKNLDVNGFGGKEISVKIPADIVEAEAVWIDLASFKLKNDMCSC